MITELPSGLDVFSILGMALANPEYRDKLLFLVGIIFGFGFVVGVGVCAIFMDPHIETKVRELEKEVSRHRRR